MEKKILVFVSIFFCATMLCISLSALSFALATESSQTSTLGACEKIRAKLRLGNNEKISITQQK